MDIILEITKKIAAETQLYNIALKKKMGKNRNEVNLNNPLKDFYWDCWDSMLPETKSIHYKRSAILYYNDAIQADPVKIHAFFVQEREKAGWILADKRLDFIIKDGNRIWVGHDPYLKSLNDCPAWFQEWCIARNGIAEKITKEYL